VKVYFVKTSNQGKPWCFFLDYIYALEKIQISFSLLTVPPTSLTIIGRNRFGTSYFLFIFGHLKFSIYVNLFSLKKITNIYLHVKESLFSWEKCSGNVHFLFLTKVVKKITYKCLNSNGVRPVAKILKSLVFGWNYTRSSARKINTRETSHRPFSFCGWRWRFHVTILLCLYCAFHNCS